MLGVSEQRGSYCNVIGPVFMFLLLSCSVCTLRSYTQLNRQIRAIQSVNSEFKKEGKATKTLAIIVGVFLTFWIPFFICNLIDPFIGYSVPPLLFDLFLWVGYYNSTCNPIVYAFFYSWFRHASESFCLEEYFIVILQEQCYCKCEIKDFPAK